MLSNKNSIILLIVIITVSSLPSISSLKLDSIYANADSSTNTTSERSIPVYMITTRGDLNLPVGESGYGYNNQYQFGDINQLKSQCPSEIAIFVHGWHNDKFKAKERLDRLKLSLEYNNYNISLIGFSWDSNKDWDSAKVIAQENGPKLANFIIDYVNTCKNEHEIDSNIRLISHSLGARVILNALDTLHTNPTWNNNGYKIASVHLLGAAVDANEVSKNPVNLDSDYIEETYGNAIQDEVVKFYNLYNPEDNILQFVYPVFEDTALGKDGSQQDIEKIYKITKPPYYDIDIKNEIAAISNADGIADSHNVFCGLLVCDEIMIEEWDNGLCLPYYVNFVIVKTCKVAIGDNHSGYIGYRDIDNTNRLENDGAVNVIVNNWRNP
jgi:hypothetical protein